MLMTRIIKIIILINLISVQPDISAQEILTVPDNNAIVQKYYKEHPYQKKSGSADTISLPFFDDFSDSHVIPKSTHWTDRDVFINNSYAIFPVSAGVATFDAIDYKGALYSNASTTPFQADYLSSKPLNLAFNPSDSIYLSFYFQPKGNGEMPETTDSLLLDFYSVTSHSWRNIWKVPGDTTIKKFRRVMIRIVDQQYLQKGFRFRFRNIASLFQNRNKFSR